MEFIVKPLSKATTNIQIFKISCVANFVKKENSIAHKTHCPNGQTKNKTKNPVTLYLVIV